MTYVFPPEQAFHLRIKVASLNTKFAIFLPKRSNCDEMEA